MMNRLLEALATVVRRVASVIPSVSIPFAEIADALSEWTETFRLWMETFPFLHTMVVILGLMIAVGVATIVWYWVNWLIRKLPFIN